MKTPLQKNSSTDPNVPIECGHEDRTICLKCATKTFNGFQKDIQRVEEEKESLQQRFEILQGRFDKPLCWTCRFGTCVRIRVPNSSSFNQSIDQESWKDPKEAKSVDIWHIVCAFPGHVPGLAPSRFVVEAVLDCNNFEERKDKTKKSPRKNVK